jgi:hypothetical protein
MAAPLTEYKQLERTNSKDRVGGLRSRVRARRVPDESASRGQIRSLMGSIEHLLSCGSAGGKVALRSLPSWDYLNSYGGGLPCIGWFAMQPVRAALAARLLRVARQAP